MKYEVTRLAPHSLTVTVDTEFRRKITYSKVRFEEGRVEYDLTMDHPLDTDLADRVLAEILGYMNERL